MRLVASLPLTRLIFVFDGILITLSFLDAHTRRHQQLS